jgi:hypothetical protein
MLAEGHGPRCVHRLGFQWRRFLFASDFVSGWLFRGVFSDVWGFVGVFIPVLVGRTGNRDRLLSKVR